MLAGKHILIVEDETLIAMALEDIVAELGCSLAASASNLNAAVEAARTVEHLDAAILDIELGARDRSWPVAEILAGRGVPFLFASGHGADADIDPRFTSHPILEKPYDSESVREALVSLLSSPLTANSRT